jgi:hypothetical protein
MPRISRLLPFFTFVLVLCLIGAAHAQYGASIQGTVTDKSGAVVPGATVTVTNQATGVAASTKATEAGYYRVAALAPGLYTVTVEAASFGASTAKDVEVIAETVRGLNVTLLPSGAKETVNVSAEAVGIETENANLDSTLTSTQINRLPTYGRDPYELLRLSPNVFGDGARDSAGRANWFPNTPGPGKGDTSGIFNQESYVQVSANGQRPSANNFTIDGTSVNSLTWGGATIITPNQESIQGITVVSSTYSAEDGRNSGAQVKAVSKSGTNNLHGSGFFKYDTPGFNSAPSWAPSGATPKAVEYAGRQFGGSIGGPVVKNKLFFFFSYEGNRSNSVSFGDPQYVETPALSQWIINNRPGTPVAQVLSSGNNAPRIAQVLTPSCNDWLNNGTAYGPAPYHGCQVVGNGVDLGSPTGAYGTYVPYFTGDTTGGGFDGVADMQKVIIASPLHSRGNQFNLRVDYNTGKDLFAFTSYYVPRNDISPTGYRPSTDLTFQPRNKYGAILWNRTFSPTLLNEFRFNATRQQNNQYSSNSNVYWGLPAFEVEAMPYGTRDKWGPPEGTNSPLMMAQNQFEFRDTMTKIRGHHAFKFGGSFTNNQDNNDYEFGGARPVYVFHGIWNLANGTPIYEGYQGDPKTGAPTDDHKYYRQNDWALFFQDDFKVSSTLTLNLGLRYEYFAPLNEKFGRQANLILSGTGANALKNSSLVPTNPLYPSDRNNFAPRLGFAWSPRFGDQKTVVRGGFGVSYNRITDTMTAISRRNPPYMFAYGLCCGTAANEWSTPYANGTIDLNVVGNNLKSINNYAANPALTNNIDPATNFPFNGQVEIWGAPQKNRTPYIYNYSLEVQQELKGNIIATVGFAGSQSRKLFRIVNENNILTPNPHSFAVYFPTTDANANYNALLLNVRRNFSNGLQFFGKYTWSKSLDTVSGEGACACTNQFYPPNQTWDHGPSDFDATHAVAMTALYDLPIFKHRDDVLGKAFGGWHLNGTFQFHSGFPWSAVDNHYCTPVPSGNGICPSLPVGYNGKGGNSASTDTFTNQGGNFPLGGTSYFTLSSNGGPVGPPFIHRNSFRGPRFSAFDLSFGKTTKLAREGQVALDYRVNFYNAFNKLNLAPFQYNSASTGVYNNTFGMATAALAGRVINMQMRLTF